jgi:hypothetical protein
MCYPKFPWDSYYQGRKTCLQSVYPRSQKKQLRSLCLRALQLRASRIEMLNDTVPIAIYIITSGWLININLSIKLNSALHHGGPNSHALIAGIGYFETAEDIFWRSFVIAIYSTFLLQRSFVSGLRGNFLSKTIIIKIIRKTKIGKSKFLIFI